MDPLQLRTRIGITNRSHDPHLSVEFRLLNRKLLMLALLAALAIVLYLTVDVSDWGFALPRRGRKVLAMALVGTAVSYSTVLFQTITNNRILTPSIIGFDALYILIQTAITFIFGASVLISTHDIVLFAVSVVCMIFFAGILYRWLFSREGAQLYFMILVGVIFGTLFSNLSSFMQKLLDPNEFSVLQSRLFASVSNVNEELLLVSLAGIAAAVIYGNRFVPLLDVIGLGRDAAVNLGIRHEQVVNRLLIVIALLVAISTALVGPITFLGLLVANVTYQYMDTWRHRYLLPAAALMSAVGLVGCQLLLEHLFTFSTTLTVIVNFIGGIYFLYLLLRKASS